MGQRYRVQFPAETGQLNQDEAYFNLLEGERRLRIRFHDYNEIYKRPGLYEQVFYERLKCNSPQVITDILARAVQADSGSLSELRVLDLGAGNGVMGELLAQKGVARVVGADIIPEAREAALRDRPGVYDEYYVGDFGNLNTDQREAVSTWQPDCLTCVAALGFGDIPPVTFFRALEFVAEGGWVAFNIKETFLDRTDESGFSRMIRELIFSDYLDIHHLQRYRHRLSMEGKPLFYFALVARKVKHIPEKMLTRAEVAA